MDPSTMLAAEYSAKADAYARYWSPVIRPMALPLLEALPLATAKRVLDVGAGTGALLPDLRRAAPFATIIGSDYSEGMLRFARRAAGEVLLVSDAQKLPIGANAVDVAVLVFVLFHIPDPLQALREVRRVLRDDGHVGIAAWGRAMDMPGVSVWTEELNREGANPDPRDSSVMQHALMDTPEKLRALVTSAGFTDVAVSSRTFHHQFNADELFEVQHGCGVAARRLPSLDERRRAACERRVKARLEHFDADALTYQPEVLFATGAKK